MNVRLAPMWSSPRQDNGVLAETYLAAYEADGA